jgi:hypothetical protein
MSWGPCRGSFPASGMSLKDPGMSEWVMQDEVR